MMGLLGRDPIIEKGDLYQYRAGYPLAPPPAAHRARSEDLSPDPPNPQPPGGPDFSLPCPQPGLTLGGRGKLEASSQRGVEKGTLQRNQLSRQHVKSTTWD